MSWERAANLDEEDKYEDIFCSEHHPAHQSWFKKHRKLVQEHESDAMDALCGETSTPKRARLVATQTIASTADQLQKLTNSKAEPIGKTKNKRESVVENVEVIGDIHKEVGATPTSRVSSMKKVMIRVDGKKVVSGRRK